MCSYAYAYATANAQLIKVVAYTAGTLAEQIRSLGLLRDALQRTMSSSIIATALKLKFVHKAIFDELMMKKVDFENSSGQLMVFQDSLRFAEEFRRADCRRYQLFTKNSIDARLNPAWDVPKFHLMYRSDHLVDCK